MLVVFVKADIGDKGMVAIFEPLCETTKVKQIKLIRNKITDDGASILFKVDSFLPKALAKNKSVEMLNMSSNLVTDACLQNLVELAKCNKTLKKINLGQNNISARKAADVVKLLKDHHGISLTL